MKVFKRNDCDWVCAKSAQDAKDYYLKETGVDILEIEEDFDGEVSLQDTMFVDLDSLQEEDLEQPQMPVRWGGSIWIVKTFEWVIETSKIVKPCIISSTEY